MLPILHCILSFWCFCVFFFSAHFSQQLMLTFLCILPILLFLISFSLVHTSCTFLLLALHCIWFDNQLLFFSGYTSIWVHFNFAHCHEHLLFFNLLFFKNSVISCFNSFVVCCLIVQVFFFFCTCLSWFFIYLYIFYFSLVLGYHGIWHTVEPV